MFARLKQWARNARRDAYAVALAARDPRVPWYAKVLAVAVAGYALSPLDLIPDFIPVVGFVDDVILVPLGIVLVVKLVPAEILQEHRANAQRAIDLPKSRIGAAAVICLWLAAVGFSIWVMWRLL